MKWFLTLLLLLVLPFAGSALTVSTSYINSTSDDDNTDNGAAGNGQATIGGTSTSVDAVGNSSDLGYRFTGYNAGRGVWNFTQQAESIVQSVNITVTWDIYAESWETYSFTLNPELHAFLNILDDNNSESGDIASVSTFSAVLKKNGSTILNSLDLSGASISTVGSSNVNDTATQVFTGLTGDNTFSITYTGTVTATWKIAGIQDNRTADAVLWGQNGTMAGDSFPSNFDEYGTSTDRLADGLFVPATVTLDAIPEPASLLLIGAGAVFLRLLRRFYGK